MIIKNDFNKIPDYNQMKRDGLNKAVDNFNKRFKEGMVERENFIKQNHEFAKKQQELKK